MTAAAAGLPAARSALPAAGVLLAWLAIYLPEAGRGFIKDDFAWLLAAPLAPSWWDAAWTASTGFFRPLVSLSFTANHALFGLHPLGYGLTNVALALAAASVIVMLARACGLSGRGAAIAAGLWLFTPHGMDMAVIWISGRVTLLLVLLATAACWAAARGHLVTAALLTAAALLAKEEAVIVPVLAALVMGGARDGAGARRTAGWAAATALILFGYFWLRSASGAMTPWSAPEEYRYAFGVGTLVENIGQYADRLVTFPALACAVTWIATRGGARAAYRPGVVALGLVWAAVAMLPTVALPVRSSLYVLLALVGTSMAAASLIDLRLAAASVRQRRTATVAFLVLAIAAVPIYRSRQDEWSGAARLSARVTAEAPAAFAGVPDGAHVFVPDWPAQPNLESTFGTLLPEMLKVTTGKTIIVTATPDEAQSSVSLAPVPR